jgi:isorenieratene synthase
MNSRFQSLLSAQISRRTVLKLAGISTVGGALGYSRFSKPQPSTYDEDAIVLPRTVGQPRRAVVVGGGLAGLAAAYELSQRGVEVTLMEKSPQLGGKIASWDIDVGGEALRMEHGFHGFFPQYYNLWSLVDELEAQHHFTSLPFYTVVYKGDKKNYAPEMFRPSHSAFPWNIVDLAISSDNRLNWGLNLLKYAHWQVFREITGFHPQRSFSRLDEISVADWVENDFPQGLYDLYFLPFAKSSLNSPDVLSAGELMQFFHFYFFGNPEGLAFRGTRQDMGRSLVNPIADAIRRNGGQILTDVSVTQVNWGDGKVASLNYVNGAAVSPAPFWVDKNELLAAPNESMQFYGAGDRVYATTDQQDALSLTCTHQGCTVKPSANGEFHCPCHGAVYDAQGRVISGPARRDLARYKVQDTKGDRIQLASAMTTEATPTTLDADYFVFATDIPGVRYLLDNSSGEVPVGLRDQIAQLVVADPFAVARFWFDQDFDWSFSDFTSLSGYRLTDSITLYHRIQDDYIEWAKKTGGSVVELHAYCYKEKEFPDQQALLTTFENELYDVVPELRSAQMLHRELVNQKNFAGFPPGSYANRPETQSLAPNLLFAGDWVKMPFPCGLMERAVSSGLLAANTVLHYEGAQRRTLLTVRPEGMFSMLA